MGGIEEEIRVMRWRTGYDSDDEAMKWADCIDQKSDVDGFGRGNGHGLTSTTDHAEVKGEEGNATPLEES